MPKVSQEHLERRRQQIMDAARECFTKQGFYNTSMQDIFKASGLSAGAVYRYFPSKHQLVKAIAEDSLEIAMARLPLTGDGPQSMADIVTVLGGAFSTDGALAGIRPMVMQVWAEAPRDPEMAAIAREVLSRLEERIERVLPPGSPPEVAWLLTATLQGFLVQSLVFGDLTQEQVAAAARAAFR
jgi:TetR/AcrR family transcriptional regulator, transcriptional repressor of aconitase